MEILIRDIMHDLIGLAVICFPIINGPAAAIAFIFAIKRGNRWLLASFLPLLAIATVVSFPWMACTWGHSYPGGGYFAWSCMPIGAFVSFVILLLSVPNVWKALGDNWQRRIWYVAGLVAVPFLQLLTEVVFPLVHELLDDWLFDIGLGLFC